MTTLSSETDSNPQSMEPKPEIEQVNEEIKTNDKEHIEDVNSCLPPDMQHYTLDTLSEEIDKFLSDLAERGNAVRDQEAKEDTKGDDHCNYDRSRIPYLDRFLDLVGEKIAKHESKEVGRGNWRRLRVEDASSFLECASRVAKLVASLDGFKSDQGIYAQLKNRIRGVQQRAMSYLEEEFRLMLEDAKTNRVLSEPEKVPEQGEAENFFLGYSEDVVLNLNKIAKGMVDGGYESECCQVYMTVRRQAFDDCLSKIGFENLSIDEVQKMQWEALEREILPWIKTFKDCSALYFAKERDLAEGVFSGHPSISSSLFSNLMRGVVIQLFNFAEGVAMTNRSAEKLFKFLDMYEVLRDCVPAMHGLFPDECENKLKSEAFSARSRIGEAAISIFCDLENSIKADIGKTPVPGGAVHPLTRYTMNYLEYACEYKATLEQVFHKHSQHGDNSKSNGEDQETRTPFSHQLMRVMDLLDANLDSKSKLYRDVALSNIFMMNNGRYILQKIKTSPEIRDALGNTWLRKKSSDLRNYHKSYQRETWNKLLACLHHEGLQVNGKVVKPVLKERFKSFATMFDEIHKTQSSWIVKDEQLKSELRVSISAVIIPAYRSFVGRFSQYFTHGRQYEKYIKYQPDDLESLIDDLFEGNTNTMARKKL